MMGIRTKKWKRNSNGREADDDLRIQGTIIDMTTQIEIRPPHTDELKEVFRIRHDALEPPNAPVQTELDGFDIQPGSRLLAAFIGGKLVGTVLAVALPNAGIIEQFAVDEAYRRQGIGSALLKEAVGVASAVGAQSVEVFAFAEPEVISFFEKHEFIVAPGQDPIGIADILLMTKVLQRG